jgi:hypothetical protein
MSLAFLGPSSTASEIIAKDAFLNAFEDDDLRFRILDF